MKESAKTPTKKKEVLTADELALVEAKRNSEKRIEEFTEKLNSLMTEYQVNLAIDGRSPLNNLQIIVQDVSPQQ